MNRVTLIGNLCGDPQMKSTASGVRVGGFTLAVDRRGKAEEGQPGADFFRVTLWRQLAESCARYLRKGSMVCVEGEIRAVAWLAGDGSPRASLEVTARDVAFLGKSMGRDPEDSGAAFVPVTDEDLPF